MPGLPVHHQLPESTQTHAQQVSDRWGDSGNCQTLFLGAPKSLQMMIAVMKLKDAYSLEGKL